MATPTRHFRIPDEDWQTALAAVQERGETISGVLRGMLADYVSGNLPGYTSGFAAGREAQKRAHTQQDQQGVGSPDQAK